ncbi:hypothetical protein AVEN_109094-1 [Araneus ventricosus]|uniref:Uncharacterized protein n=1 Tax=Araneus ventricosus TaxID=182803 RepID=A0A4Y2I9H6_ARAVE|nr:hypothetical protein AVEN_109094-1 [Araneus ventricosus]
MMGRWESLAMVINETFTPHKSAHATPKSIIRVETGQNWRGIERKVGYPTYPDIHNSTPHRYARATPKIGRQYGNRSELAWRRTECWIFNISRYPQFHSRHLDCWAINVAGIGTGEGGLRCLWLGARATGNGWICVAGRAPE